MNTTTTTPNIDRHLELALADLAATGRSTAAWRSARLDAEDRARELRRAARRAETEARRAARRQAVIEARARYWAAR